MLKNSLIRAQLKWKFDYLKCFLTPKLFVKFMLILGALLYFRQYYFNRSLWSDEAKLALAVMEMDIFQLFNQPLLFAQAAPVGYLIIIKICGLLGGYTEYSLRLFSLLCGFLSLWLFPITARYLLKTKNINLEVICALVLFVFNFKLIYYASEIKPYIVDVCAVLISYAAISKCLDNLSIWKAVFIGLLGSILIWFSAPVSFVLAGIGLTHIFSTLFAKNKANFIYITTVCMAWLLSFFINYQLVLKKIIHSKGVERYWQDGYLKLHEIDSWIFIFNNFINDPLGFGRVKWIVSVVLLFGIIKIWKLSLHSFFLLLSPLVLILIASALELYSLKTRLVLFLIPIFIIFLGVGVVELSSKLKKFQPIFLVILILIILWFPSLSVYKNFKHPKDRDYFRDLLKTIETHHSEHHKVYIHTLNIPAYLYYRQVYHYADGPYLHGNSEKIKNDLLESSLSGTQDIWIVFPNSMPKHKSEQQVKLFEFLNRYGRKRYSYKVGSNSAILYSLSYKR